MQLSREILLLARNATASDTNNKNGRQYDLSNSTAINFE